MTCIEGRELDALELSNNIDSLKIGDYIGKGASRKGVKSKWFEMWNATKIIVGTFEKHISIEVDILARLSHSNLMHYFFATKVKTNKFRKSCSMEGRNETLYLIKELMDVNLIDFLKEKNQWHFLYSLILCIKLQKECVIYMIFKLHIGI